MKALSIYPIKTDIFRSGDLINFLVRHVPNSLIREEMIIAITSKIVSVAESNFVAKDSISKKNLVKKEADKYLGEISYGCFLTVKNGLLIPSAGIDESNSENEEYILYPKDPFRSVENIWFKLRKLWNIKNLGVILTDSHTTPLRRGVTGIALAYRGFCPLKSLVGKEDLFGRTLRMTTMNLADGLASAAVFTMGEGAESTPIAIIHGAGVEFTELDLKEKLSIAMAEDLYGPMISNFETTQNEKLE